MYLSIQPLPQRMKIFYYIESIFKSITVLEKKGGNIKRSMYCTYIHAHHCVFNKMHKNAINLSTRAICHEKKTPAKKRDKEKKIIARNHHALSPGKKRKKKKNSENSFRLSNKDVAGGKQPQVTGPHRSNHHKATEYKPQPPPPPRGIWWRTLAPMYIARFLTFPLPGGTDSWSILLLDKRKYSTHPDTTNGRQILGLGLGLGLGDGDDDDDVDGQAKPPSHITAPAGLGDWVGGIVGNLNFFNFLIL